MLHNYFYDQQNYFRICIYLNFSIFQQNRSFRVDFLLYLLRNAIISGLIVYLKRRNDISRGWPLLHNFIESTHLKIEPSALSRTRRADRYIKDHGLDETIYLLLSRRGAYKQPFAPAARRLPFLFSRVPANMYSILSGASKLSRAVQRGFREGIRGRRGGRRVLIKGVCREESLSRPSRG